MMTRMWLEHPVKDKYRGTMAIWMKIWGKEFKLQLLAGAVGGCGWRPGHAAKSRKMDLQRRDS